jgi:hypothetical protein
MNKVTSTLSTHKVAQMMLSAPDGELTVSIDMPNEGKVFAYTLIDITLPSTTGFGSSECVLLFEDGSEV